MSHTPNDSAWSNTNALDLLDKEDLIKLVRSMMDGGVTVNFQGKRFAQELYKRVRPRQTLIKKELSVGLPEEQARNLIIEGENLQAMVTLYKERGQVDLILTDPPYNTGQTFRYNDKWDSDPNDPELGQIVKMDDGSRHTKWMKVMLPRLNMLHAMLKPSGVLAICIDDNELFHLGMMLDEIFGEQNRIAIINWQKSYAPKNDTKHVSTATEYVLVYAKDRSLSRTGLETRTAEMNKSYKNPDKDPIDVWASDNPTSRDRRDHDRYGIQSPFTGAIHYPGSASWRIPRSNMKGFLEAWGSVYEKKDIGDGRAKAFVIKGAPVPRINSSQNLDNEPVAEDKSVFASKAVSTARTLATAVRDNEVWPYLHFLKKGHGRPRVKRYLRDVKKGRVPLTYWADEDYETPAVIGAQSWDHEDSGHSQSGISELNALLGKGHNFDTVKPLKLFKKVIQLWCPPNGLILDPYAGSGTSGHAVLELNAETGANRRFIMIEQGAPEKGDKYARSLTQERLRRAITGERPDASNKLKSVADPLPGGFQFRMLTKKIDSRAVLSMRKDELIDLVITSHWEGNRRGGCGLIRFEEEGYRYLVGCNEQNEGYFLIWNGGDKVGQLDDNSYSTVISEGKRANLKQPYHVYARYELYQSRNVVFYKIPDKILAHLGLNESSDTFNEDGEE